MDQNENITPPIDTPTPVEAPVPAPEAPQEIPTPQEAPAPQASPEPDPAKKSKAVVWLLSFLLILAIAAAAVFAYFYFNNQTSQPTPQGGSSETTPSEETESDEEVVITDTYILRDLDEKMAILHISTSTDATTIKIRGMHQELPLYTDGGLSDAAKLAHVMESLKNSSHVLTMQERESVVANEISNCENCDERNIANIKQYAYSGVDGDIVVAKYLDVFGENLVYDKTKHGKPYCPYYRYDENSNIYYDPGGGCGGTSPYTNYYYKSSYTMTKENAYVTVSAATYDDTETPGTIYCDIIGRDSSAALPDVCGTADNYDDFTIDETNYQHFTQYRFIFDKAENGTYYFEKVEKL